MDNIVREGEQFLDGQGGNQSGSQGMMDQSNLQDNQQGQQAQQGQQGGGFMKNVEQNAGDAYVNQGMLDSMSLMRGTWADRVLQKSISF